MDLTAAHISEKKKRIKGSFATPAQTKRWIKSVKAWAEVNRKSSDEIAEMLEFSHRSNWFRLITGRNRRVRNKIMTKSIQDMGLDAAFINGVYDYKHRFSETRNIFTDFEVVYAGHMSKGQFYQASQIIRKAAVFVFETLIPKDIIVSLTMENRKNEYESAKLLCSLDEVTFFVINIFGDKTNVRFTMSKKVGSMDVPTMEGVLDIHAVSAIRRQFSLRKKSAATFYREKEMFDNNAKALTDKNLCQAAH